MTGCHATTATLAFSILLNAFAIGCGENVGASAPRSEANEYSTLQEALRLSCHAKLDEAVQLFSSIGTGSDHHAAALHSLGSIAAIRGDVLLSGMYHGAAKARNPRAIPPLAEMHLEGKECNGIGDIFWTSSLTKKTIYETFFESAEGGLMSVPFERLAEDDFMTYVETAKRDADQARRDKLFEAHVGLATQLEDSGFVEDSASHFVRASELKPDHVGLKVRNALSVPVVYESIEHVRDVREALVHKVSRLLASARGGNVTIDSLDHLSMPGTYYVVYAGYNDIEIMSDIGELYRLLYPSLNRPMVAATAKATDDRIKVGFASHYFRNHSVCKLLCGMIRHLDQIQFHVTLFSSTETEDDWTDYVAKRADDFVRVPEGFLVKNRHLATTVDVLVFPDVGMSVGSTVWAHGRMAPVQISFWGHPVTTGLHVDFFVTSDRFEADDGRDQFTEQLVRMDSLSFYFRSPKNAASSRQEILEGSSGSGFDWTSLGIPNDGVVFLCPQTLPKFHPAFDEVLHKVLDLDEKAHVLVIYDKEKPLWKKTLSDRFKAFSTHHRRLIFAPTHSHDDFLRIVRSSALLLDPFPFGGGVTTLEAFAECKAVVTLPSRQTVPRLTAGMIGRMGLERELIANDIERYVDIVSRLLKEDGYRRSVEEEICRRREVLYEQDDTVEEWESFLFKAHRQAEHQRQEHGEL